MAVKYGIDVEVGTPSLTPIVFLCCLEPPARRRHPLDDATDLFVQPQNVPWTHTTARLAVVVPQALFHYLGLPFELTDISGGPLVSMFVVALALNKLTIPVRLAVTGAVVPTVAKRLRRRFPDFSQKWLGLGPKTKPPLNM